VNADCVIVDANIAFKTLAAGRGDLRNPLSPAVPLRFFAPRFLFVELFKHKDRLIHASRLTEEEVLQALYTLVSRIEFIKEADVPLGTWMEAHRLCRYVDEKDTPYVALALHLEGRLWTEDAALKTGLQARGFDAFFGI
jgi:predicted nucleic acid-binding protein